MHNSSHAGIDFDDFDLEIGDVILQLKLTAMSISSFNDR